MRTITLEQLLDWRKRKREVTSILEMKRVGREFQAEFDLMHLKGGDIFELLNDKPLTIEMLKKINFTSQK